MTRLAYFDAHNHVHLSMPGRIPPVILPPLDGDEAKYASAASAVSAHAKIVANFAAGPSAPAAFDSPSSSTSRRCDDSVTIGGMGLMSTQPRDFVPVNILCNELRCKTIKCVPCYGVHPWFLQMADEDSLAYSGMAGAGKFWWEDYLRKSLEERPDAAVGEIGLDGARYDPATGDLVTPLDRQVEAFETQLRMAVDLERPVSIHAVRAWGPLLDTLNKQFGKKKGDKPPRMYFHAFGGKPSVVDQINAACRGTLEVLYGFAPCINFRSKKTADVIRKIGIDSLVLETDVEDYRRVKDDLDANASFVAEALGMCKEEVTEKTAANAMRFYGLS